MKNRVRGGNNPVLGSDFFAGVEVAIKPGEIAAGDFQTKSMPAKEHIAGGPEIECDLLGLARINQRCMFP
jgi:hypothetical protein